ncbi:MAG: metal-dependent hydrolase [Planctomycetota bacterium]|nr:metal-dependent hydrolase [Planctomycetota bacterium]
MALSMTFLGHSGFVFDDGNHKLAIDPFLTGNPVAKAKPEDVRCSYIALTHGHEDHVGDTESIAKTNDATVLAAYEICNYLGKQGVKKLEPGNPGGKINTDFGWVAFTQAFHSSSYQGQYMGLPCGLIVNMGGATVYHCGDTALFSDMKLIGEIYKPDIACIPIGDRFTMGPELGTRAAEFIKPKVAIPIHYATFPGMLVPDASGFTPTGVEVKILEPGETWRYG